jgi:hypothetical protein
MIPTRVLILFFFILLANVLVASAQPGGGGDPGNGQPVPIPFVWILLSIGGIFGIRATLRGRTKKYGD